MKLWDLKTGELLVTMYNLADGFLWATPPTENAPSGWLWTNRKDLISVVERKKDGSDPRALADGNPDREAYLALYNDQKMVMSRLQLPLEEIRRIEEAWERLVEGHKQNQIAGRNLSPGLRPGQ